MDRGKAELIEKRNTSPKEKVKELHDKMVALERVGLVF